jgi:catechol 2,3-dioxygenase-like lactoylglutathione lyase family enzyme
MKLFRLFAACLIACLPAISQPPGQRGVTLGHVHLNSANPEAALAFWTEVIGASAFKRESLTGVTMIGGMILISKSDAPGPSAGSVIDRIALHVPALDPFVARLEKSKYKSAPVAGAEGQLLIEGPDGLKVQLNEDNSMFAPLEFEYVQFFSPQPAEMQAWYSKTFGARPNTEDKPNSSRVGGGTLVFDKADSVKPSAGRAIDHIAFEVKGLEDFCKKLSADGIEFDTPFHSIPELKMASAFLTDPWGTRIELTEGLSH